MDVNEVVPPFMTRLGLIYDNIFQSERIYYKTCNLHHGALYKWTGMDIIFDTCIISKCQSDCDNHDMWVMWVCFVYMHLVISFCCLSAILLHWCIHVYMVYISVLFHKIIYSLICNQHLFTMSNTNIFHLVFKHVHVIVLTH